MEIELNLNIGTFSSNSSHYRSGNLREEARQYRLAFWKELNKEKNKSNIDKFLNYFNDKKHCLRITYEFFIEKDKFFTKKNVISNRAGDIDNMIKLPQDFLFNSRYHKKHLKELNLINLNTDDKFITQLIAKKIPSDKPSLRIKIEILGYSSQEIGT